MTNWIRVLRSLPPSIRCLLLLLDDADCVYVSSEGGRAAWRSDGRIRFIRIRRASEQAGARRPEKIDLFRGREERESPEDTRMYGRLAHGRDSGP